MSLSESFSFLPIVRPALKIFPLAFSRLCPSTDFYFPPAAILAATAFKLLPKNKIFAFFSLLSVRVCVIILSGKGKTISGEFL